VARGRYVCCSFFFSVAEAYVRRVLAGGYFRSFRGSMIGKMLLPVAIHSAPMKEDCRTTTKPTRFKPNAQTPECQKRMRWRRCKAADCEIELSGCSVVQRASRRRHPWVGVCFVYVRFLGFPDGGNGIIAVRGKLGPQLLQVPLGNIYNIEISTREK
jgi:hypothetical protein